MTGSVLAELSARAPGPSVSHSSSITWMATDIAMANRMRRNQFVWLPAPQEHREYSRKVAGESPAHRLSIHRGSCYHAAAAGTFEEDLPTSLLQKKKSDRGRGNRARASGAAEKVRLRQGGDHGVVQDYDEAR